MTDYDDVLLNILNNVENKDDILNSIKNNIKLDAVIDNNKLLNKNISLDDNILINKLKIHKNIIDKCEHEWVNDLIDIDPERSQYICYCCKCELTK